MPNARRKRFLKGAQLHSEPTKDRSVYLDAESAQHKNRPPSLLMLVGYTLDFLVARMLMVESRIPDKPTSPESPDMDSKNVTDLVKKLQEQQRRLNRHREAADRARQKIQKRRQFTIKVSSTEHIGSF